MGLIRELRVRARHVIGPALGLAALVYVGYHGVEGERGLRAWQAHEHQILVARAKLKDLIAERSRLEAHVRLLHPASLDRDMLDEWSRRLLNMGRPDEIIILTRGRMAPEPSFAAPR